MEIKIPAAIFIFVGSYFPLSVILLAQDFRYELVGASICFPWNQLDNPCVLPLRNPLFSLPFLLVSLICFVVTVVALLTVKASVPINIEKAKYVPSELMSYTLPYIVSFMSLDYQEIGRFVGLGVFLFWIFLITYRSGQTILNPLLIVLGWKLFEVDFKYPGSPTVHFGRMLATDTPTPNSRWKSISFQSIMVARTPKQDGGGG